MLIYTFRFEKLKNKASFRRKNWRKYTQKKLKILPKAIEKIEP